MLFLAACLSALPPDEDAPPGPPPLPTVPPGTASEPATPTGETGAATTCISAPFTPCGGEFRGTTWRFGATCPGDGEIVSSAQCGDIRVSWIDTFEGTIRFDEDGAFTLDQESRHIHTDSVWPGADCAPAGCEALASYVGYLDGTTATCADDGAGGCACQSDLDFGAEVVTGDWWVDDYYWQAPRIQIGTLYPNSASSFEQWRWCVSGDELQLEDRFGGVTVLAPE